MNHAQRIITKGASILTLAFSCISSIAQTPYLGTYIEEIPIPASISTSIDASLTSGGVALPKCYRVYICCSEPNWELQAIYGGDGFPAWTLNTTTQFYQNSFGSHIGSGISSALFGVLPELQFDSWFTINADDSTDPSNIFTLQSTPPAFFDWETTGLNFNSGSVFGSAISNLPTYPSFNGMPDGLNRILIAQLTTDGSFTGVFNFQFRKMNANGTPFSPNTVVRVNNVAISLLNASNTPCALLLPIELLNFQCIPNQSSVDLTWETSAEIDNDYFILEHSLDQFNWKSLTQIAGAGNTMIPHNYSYKHLTPGTGINYYRLKQFDFNGEFHLSETMEAPFLTHEKNEVTIYPNPCNSEGFQLSGNISEITEINLVSDCGSVIQSWKCTGNLNQPFETNVASGHYIVQIKFLNGEFCNQQILLNN